MELKTDSGVSITIIEEGSSKILVFSKPVRAVGLNKKELTEISNLLISKSNTKTIVATKKNKTATGGH
jgi:hypothetical protein